LWGGVGADELLEQLWFAQEQANVLGFARHGYSLPGNRQAHKNDSWKSTADSKARQTIKCILVSRLDHDTCETRV
jgi:hypothetical protein